MQNIQEHLARFRDLFSLPADSRAFHRDGSCWIRLSVNEFGLLRLQRGENYEGVVAELMWYEQDLVSTDGLDFNLAVLLYVAEKLGLPTDHPALSKVRQTDEYKEMLLTGKIVLE